MSAGMLIPSGGWTAAEWHDVVAMLQPDESFLYAGISATQLGLARHSGDAMIDGRHYTYIPASDELIRSDVLQLIAASRKCAAKVAGDAAKAKQGQLL